MNILQSIFQSIQGPKQPPHVGEVFHIWAYYVELGESEAILTVLLNHTHDVDLKQIMEHFIADVLTPQRKALGELMKNEGINPAELTPIAAKADEKAIPPGAKMTHALLAQMIMVKVQGLLLYSYQTLAICLRDDIGRIFLGFFHTVLAQGFTLKHTMQQRGWLKVPPFYYASSGASQ